MRTRILAALVAATMAALLVPLLVPLLATHEAKTVGKYHFVIGFGDEPAYAGEKNSVQLLLADATDKPVTDLTDTLKVEVTTGDTEALQLAMEPNFEVGEFGTPGDYRAFFIPTAPGSYRFHFTGTIKGQRIDQTFTSRPKSFSDMEDPAQVQYPIKQPTGGELATRVQRESTRVDAALAAQRDQARDQAASARTLAIVGLIVGALGLLAGLAALTLRRRSSDQGAAAADPADTTLRQELPRSARTAGWCGGWRSCRWAAHRTTITAWRSFALIRSIPRVGPVGLVPGRRAVAGGQLDLTSGQHSPGQVRAVASGQLLDPMGAP